MDDSIVKAGNSAGIDGDVTPPEDSHPDVNGLATIEDLIFPSPPLKKTYEQIRVPVVLRMSGCWFADKSGHGKSTAMSYCAEALRLEFPRMPVFVLNLHMLPANASRSIPIRLLEEVDHKVIGGETTRIKMRLAKSLAERAWQSPLRQVVLLFDEAQSLRPQDLFLLKDLSNDLACLSVGLLTVMFGESPKIEDLVDHTCAGEDHGLAERFFVKQLTLGKYESLDDWQSLLGQMDKCRFPELLNQTVPETFLINAASGVAHRLESEALAFWKAIEKNKSCSLRRTFTGIRWWILHAGSFLAKSERIPTDLWDSAMLYGACVE